MLQNQTEKTNWIFLLIFGGSLIFWLAGHYMLYYILFISGLMGYGAFVFFLNHIIFYIIYIIGYLFLSLLITEQIKQNNLDIKIKIMFYINIFFYFLSFFISVAAVVTPILSSLWLPLLVPLLILFFLFKIRKLVKASIVNNSSEYINEI